METNSQRIGMLTRLFLVISTISLALSIYLPVWRIELDAPQYPEGLSLLIYADKLAGDVEIINGLNHYIGMKTLHTEEFIEFRVLTYILGLYALGCLLVAITAHKKAFRVLFFALLVFGIIAMVDFWRWEYNYGHTLDPKAAIIVPGMSYQPPLIGFKQLLNFGAYSIPDKGGWLIVFSGLLMGVAYIKEFFLSKKTEHSAVISLSGLLLLLFSSCNTHTIESVKLNTDHCDNCGMTISDPKFATEILTQKGRVYKFDDIACMITYRNEHVEKLSSADFYVSSFTGTNNLTDVKNIVLINSELIGSPMGGNIAGFDNKDSAALYAIKFDASVISWSSLMK